MDLSDLKNDIFLIEDILENDSELFNLIINNTIWDESIKSRKTASYGIPYNYSGINYLTTKIPDYLTQLIYIVNDINNFIPNNCLINYYFDYKSKMGLHSDQIDILECNTGIAIFSLGSSRVMRFMHKKDKLIFYDLDIPRNSYLYLSQKSQIDWLHSILPNQNSNRSERISITFRKIKVI